jgi:hypothetical protein
MTPLPALRARWPSLLGLAFVLASTLGLSANVLAENANPVVSAIDFHCSVSKSTQNAQTGRGSSSRLGDGDGKIMVEGKISTRRAFSIQYIPSWEKEITYDAGNGYSALIVLSAFKYKAAGDFLLDRPSFNMTVSLIKSGQVISAASTRSEHVVKSYNHLTQKIGNLIELKLGLLNLLPGAEADGIGQLEVDCEMPVDWEFTGQRSTQFRH